MSSRKSVSKDARHRQQRRAVTKQRRSITTAQHAASASRGEAKKARLQAVEEQDPLRVRLRSPRGPARPARGGGGRRRIEEPPRAELRALARVRSVQEEEDALVGRGRCGGRAPGGGGGFGGGGWGAVGESRRRVEDGLAAPRPVRVREAPSEGLWQRPCGEGLRGGGSTVASRLGSHCTLVAL